MRFKGLDLNLLLALDALLATHSVSRAAERLNLSQPAMSAALSHLRTYFRDDILVANGKRMYATPFAEDLVPLLRDCLRNVDSLISSSILFNPATSRRTFSIVASDYIIVAVIASLVASLAKTAPSIRIKLLSLGEESTRKFVEGDADLLITAEGFHEPAFPSEVLFAERQVVVGWNKNPIFKHKLIEEDVFGVGHVAVSIGPNQVASFADRQLIALGKKRVIEVTTPAFTVLPWLLQGTNRVTLMHERLAYAMALRFPITYAPLPFEFPLMAELVQYHPARADDDGLVWLRGQLHEAAATTAPKSGSSTARKVLR